MKTRVHVLGTGTPTPSENSFGSAFAIENPNGEVIMVDCGPAATWKLAKAELSPAAVTHLFITHHHFDHNIDYPCLLLTRWDQEPDGRPLEVFGPKPTVEVTEKLVGPDGAFSDDIRARIEWTPSQKVYENRGGSLPRKGPSVNAIDIEPGFTYEGHDWSVQAAYADHAQPYLDCLSYRFNTPDGDFVFTGDTAPCDTVRQLASGADALFCMAWETDAVMSDSGEDKGVCGAGSAGRLASEAGVKKLILVHTGPRVSRSPEEALTEAAQYFDGEIVFASEVSIVDAEGPVPISPSAGGR